MRNLSATLAFLLCLLALAACDDSGGGDKPDGDVPDASDDGDVVVPDADLPYDRSDLITATDDAVFEELCDAAQADRIANKPGDASLGEFGCVATGIYSNLGWADADACEAYVVDCVADEDLQAEIVAGSAGSFDLGCDDWSTYDGDATLGDLLDCWEDFNAELVLTATSLTCENAIEDPSGALFLCPESCVQFGTLVASCAGPLEL